MDINSLSPKELNELIATATRRKRVLAKRKPLAKVRASIMKLIKDSGYTYEELFGSTPTASAQGQNFKVKRKGPKPGSKVEPKYQNPDNPADTWTGRGKKPKWLADKLEAGQSIDAFLIQPKSDPPAESQGADAT